jgi:hypothetical protein
MRPAKFLLLYLLPALAGVVAGSLFAPEATVPEHLPSAKKASQREGGDTGLVPLRDDPRAIQLAALGGRTAEAKRKVAELVASGADEGTIAEWLNPILVSDPGWMENFIGMLPEDRRWPVVKHVMSKLPYHHLDAPWEVLKQSPAVLTLMRDSSHKLQDLLTYPAFTSPQAVIFVLDPANGIASEDIRYVLAAGSANMEAALTMMEMWKSGKLPADVPQGPFTYAWLNLESKDPAALAELLKDLSPEQEEWVAQQQEEKQEHRQPTAQVEEAGGRVALDQLAGLSGDPRKAALDNYLRYSYPYHSGGVMEELRTLPRLGFSLEEQSKILGRAIDGEWDEVGNLPNAMELVEMIPEAGPREKKRQEILDSLVRYDPAGALEYAASLPAGDERTRLEQQARENLR